MNDIYTISTGGWTPEGRWTDHHPMNYTHAANTAVKMIQESDDTAFGRIYYELTVWGGSLEIVNVTHGRVTYDRELEPAEGKYIAVAVRRALDERLARYQSEHGANAVPR
jgi:hypothetical protein